MNPLDAVFAKLVGKRIAGGCADCDAFQEMRQEMRQEMPGVWVLGVFHDDGCPYLAARETS